MVEVKPLVIGDLPKLVGAAKTKLAPIVSSVKSAQVIMRYWRKKYSRLPDTVVNEVKGKINEFRPQAI